MNQAIEYKPGFCCLPIRSGGRRTLQLLHNKKQLSIIKKLPSLTGEVGGGNHVN